MLLLIIYVLIALGFSFLCSVAEAVLLSVTVGYIAVLEQEGKPSGKLLRKLKEDINQPLAAILTLNTIAHTVGAAGAGAQAALVFGSAYLGIASGILTLLILIFSEIIPKTLGAHYWQSLAPMTAYVLRILVWVLYPFVRLSEYLTRSLTDGPSLKGFNREELAAVAELSWREGLLAKIESRILGRLMSLQGTKVRDAMTPKIVVFSVPDTLTVGEYYEQYETSEFSRIPVYQVDKEQVIGFVLRDDLLLAQARGEINRPVSDFLRELPSVIDSMSLTKVFDDLLQQRAHIVLVVDEYGGVQGVLTMEDVLETVLGLEIVDESDKSSNMQELARRLWRRRAVAKGLDPAMLEFKD